MGFRGPEGAGLIESGWITPGFWPTEGPHLVVLRRLLPESGTSRRKGIGMCLRFYCSQCLGRSLIALIADGKARDGQGGRRVRGTDAGQTVPRSKAPSRHRETAERSVSLAVLMLLTLMLITGLASSRRLWDR